MIQQMGRAARNVNSKVVLYADAVTPAMRQALEETERRRAKQLEYNREHDITPITIKKAIRDGLEMEMKAHRTAREAAGRSEAEYDRDDLMKVLEEQMLQASEGLEFEKAAKLRDRLKQIKDAPQIGKISGSTFAPLEGDDYSEPAPGTPGTRPRQKKKKKSVR